MAEGTGEEKSVSGELSRLGKQVAEAIGAAWESEDRKRLQVEVTQGLESFGNEVSEALRKASESDAARQVREQTEGVITQIREGDVSEQVRKGLISGLAAINEGLGKLLERLEAPSQPAAPAEPSAETEPAGAPAEPPSSPAESAPPDV